MNDTKQILWSKSIDLLAATTVFNNGDGVSIDNRVINVVFELQQQLQQARREADEAAKNAFRRGWEQAKKEAFEIARTTQIGYIQTTIAAMEYKEKAND